MKTGFVAFIDEAGDDDLKKFKPIHQNGSSAWFILSAAVVRVENEFKTGEWLSRSLQAMKSHQRRNIHYKELPDFKKTMVCAEAAKLDARYFVVMSNKMSLLNHKNDKLPPTRRWMYWWMTRLLVERVTAFCGQKSRMIHGEPRAVEFIFSKRDDLNYSLLIDYLIKLCIQSENENLYIDVRPDWSVVDFSQIYAEKHSARAGLQLADIVASAFYQAITESHGRYDISFAKLLEPRMYRKPLASGGGLFVGYGVKTMPQIYEMSLEAGQMLLFKEYGYGRDR